MLEALKTDVVSKQFWDPSADKSTTQIVSCKSNVELFDKFGTAGRIGIVLLSVTTVTRSFVQGYLSNRGNLHAICMAQVSSLAQSCKASHHERLKSEVPCTGSEV